MNIKELKKSYDDYYKNIKGYQVVLSILSFDNSTIAPSKSLEEKADYTGIVYDDYFKLTTSDEFANIVNELYKNKDKLDDNYKRIADLAKKDLDMQRKLPAEFQRENNIFLNKAFLVWRAAKQNNDWNSFEPYLETCFANTKKMAEYYGPIEGSYYNRLLDIYEEGATTESLDKFFDSLKATIIPLLKKIQNSKVKINDDFAHAIVKHDKQMKLTKYILKINGFDFTRGCISETEHPFTDGISPNDARITTHIYENMFFSNIFSSAHEGGHAIYEQNLNNKLPDNLRNAASMAWHESQSRFYENIICRSEEYIHLIYKKVNQVLPKPYKNNVSEHDMYLAANKVEPSLVRTEADELTYTLHIIIRYELEKQLIDGKLQVKDLREAWNKLYKEYLGVDVTSDKEGVLQDSHWSSEAIGYFPSYALGNAYGAQILHTMMKDFDVYEAIKENKIKQKIGKWLKDHIYVYGEKLTPQELILKVTGEPLNPKYFEDYLVKKYTKIYKL